MQGQLRHFRKVITRPINIPKFAILMREREMEEGLLPPPVEGERTRQGAVTRFIGEVKDEGLRLGYIAGPMMAMTLSLFLIPVSSSMMVGHLGELALSSTAIATSLTAVTGFSLLVSPITSY